MKKLTRKLSIFLSVVFLTAFTPFVASAQSTGLTDVLSRISNLFGAVLPLLISLGVIYFIWGIVQYFIGDGEEAKKKGKDRIVYCIIGLAVIVSIWGLVAILNQTLGLGGTTGLVGTSAPTSISGLVATSTSSTTCSLSGTSLKLSDYLDYVTCVIGKSVIPLIFALAVVMFIWGAVKFFIIDADEEAKRTQGKQFMIWGIIALAVMISVWGLVNILGTTFNIDTSVIPRVQP